MPGVLHEGVVFKLWLNFLPHATMTTIPELMEFIQSTSPSPTAGRVAPENVTLPI